MVKANHPALNMNQAPSKSTSQQPTTSHEQAEHIISDLKVDQTLPVNDTTESIHSISNKHTHPQINTSKVIKKKPKYLSERSKLEDTWNTPEFVEEFSGRRRRSAQANQTIQHVQDQSLQQAENRTNDHSRNVNKPETTSTSASIDIVTSQDITLMSPTSSSSAPHKRKTTDSDFNDTLIVNESGPQPTEKVIVVEATDDHDNVFQPTPLEPQPQLKAEAESMSKATAVSKPKAATKPKPEDPKKKAEAKITTSCKNKTPMKAVLPVTLAPTAVQSSMLANNTVSTSSYADPHLNHHAPYQQSSTAEPPYTSSPSPNAHMQSSVNTHMQSPVNTHMQSYMQSPANDYMQPSASANSLLLNNDHSRYCSGSPTPYYEPPRHLTSSTSFHQNPVSSYQAPSPSHQVPVSFTTPDPRYFSLAVVSAVFTSRTDTALAPLNVDSGADATASHPAASDTLNMDNTEGVLTETTVQQQPSATSSVKPPRNRPMTPRTKGEQKTKAKVARNSKSKSPKAEPAAAPVVDATDTRVVGLPPSINDTDPASTSSNAPQADLSSSLAHDEVINTSKDEAIGIITEDPVPDAFHLVMKERATNTTTTTTTTTTTARLQAETQVNTQAKSTTNKSRRSNGSKAESVDAPVVDATDMIAPSLPPLSTMDAPPASSTSNAPEASSSTNANSIDLVFIKETGNAIDAKAKPKTSTLRKRNSPSKPEESKTEAVDTPMVVATDTATTTSPLNNDAAPMPAINTPEADLTQASTNPNVIDDIGSETIDITINDAAQDTVNLAENEANTSTTKGNGKSKETSQKAKAAPNATRKPKVPKAPKAPTVGVTDVSMIDNIDNDAMSSTSIHDIAITPSIGALGADLPSTSEVVSSLVDKEAVDMTTVDMTTVDSAQDTTQLAENETTAGSTKATGKSRAKTPQKPKATSSAKVSNKKKTPKAKTIETAAFETAAPEATLPSSLANMDGLDQENQAATNTANGVVPEKKRKHISKKMAAESVEQQDMDMQDESKVVDVVDGSKTKKRKEQPESSTSVSRRQSTRQKKKPKYADENDDHLMVDVDATTTTTTTPAEAAEESQVQEQVPAQFQWYFESRDSFLVNEDFKVLIPQLMSGLPIAEQAKLTKLLPPPDLEGATASNPIPVTFLSPSNTHFWEAAKKFQEVLGMGGFEPETIKKREVMRVADQANDAFKDDNYEAYWGERLERDKKQKAVAKAKTERAANRGRRGRGGRGRSRGRSRGSGRGRGRGRGRGGSVASQDKGEAKAA